MTDIRSGDLEHLHLYCRNASLVKARAFCHDKLEQAIYNIYNYASIREKNLSFAENPRTSTLQEQLEHIARNLEKQEHLIYKQVQLVTEARTTNKAILHRHALQTAIAYQQVPADKLLEYDHYPLCFRLGFIHALPEQEFDIGSARITDVGYAGFFPKAILIEMH